jgi:hypothetical protein
MLLLPVFIMSVMLLILGTFCVTDFEDIHMQWKKEIWTVYSDLQAIQFKTEHRSVAKLKTLHFPI